MSQQDGVATGAMAMGARIISVIETTLKQRGNGKDVPFRVIRQYWRPDGQLLAEVDPCPDYERYIEGQDREIKALKDAIRWALGEEGDFEAPKKGTDKLPIGKYWWRSELRRRAAK